MGVRRKNSFPSSAKVPTTTLRQNLKSERPLSGAVVPSTRAPNKWTWCCQTQICTSYLNWHGLVGSKTPFWDDTQSDLRLYLKRSGGISHARPASYIFYHGPCRLCIHSHLLPCQVSEVNTHAARNWNVRIKKKKKPVKTWLANSLVRWCVT